MKIQVIRLMADLAAMHRLMQGGPATWWQTAREVSNKFGSTAHE